MLFNCIYTIFIESSKVNPIMQRLCVKEIIVYSFRLKLSNTPHLEKLRYMYNFEKLVKWTNTFVLIKNTHYMKCKSRFNVHYNYWAKFSFETKNPRNHFGSMKYFIKSYLNFAHIWFKVNMKKKCNKYKQTIAVDNCIKIDRIKDKRMIILYAVPISLLPMLGKENRYF